MKSQDGFMKYFLCVDELKKFVGHIGHPTLPVNHFSFACRSDTVVP